MFEELEGCIRKIAIQNTLAPAVVDFSGRDHPEGWLLLATTEDDMAAIQKFNRHWVRETGVDFGLDFSEPISSDLYLICDRLTSQGDYRLAVGAMEVSKLHGIPTLEWIWVHPNYRKSHGRPSKAASASLREIRAIHGDLQVRLTDDDTPRSNFDSLWVRVFPEEEILRSLR